MLNEERLKAIRLRSTRRHGSASTQLPSNTVVEALARAIWQDRKTNGETEKQKWKYPSSQMMKCHAQGLCQQHQKQSWTLKADNIRKEQCIELILPNHHFSYTAMTTYWYGIQRNNTICQPTKVQNMDE